MKQERLNGWERCGKVTASKIADIMATIKSGEAAARANYRAELIAQRLTGTVEEATPMRHAAWHGTRTVCPRHLMK